MGFKSNYLSEKASVKGGVVDICSSSYGLSFTVFSY